MKKKSLQWVMATALALCGATTMLTACSDNDENGNNGSNSTVDEQLIGSWKLDLDGMELVDLATLDMQFNKDNTMKLIGRCYNNELGDYITSSVNATFRGIAYREIDGSMTKGLEVTYEDDAANGENAGNNSTVIKDTVYYQVADGKLVLKSYAGENEVDYGDATFEKGSTVNNSGDNSGNIQSVKDYLAKASKYRDEYNDSLNAKDEMTSLVSAGAPTRATGRDMSKWMKDIPDDRMVCQLMLPGTHDAATFGLTYGWMITLGKTQLKNWSEQFNTGIRAFDIRSRQFIAPGQSSTYLFHSMLNCNIAFSDALDDFVKILKAHPDEGIILMVKGEGNDAGKGWIAAEILNGLSKAVPFNFNFDQLNMEQTTAENLRLIEEKLLKPGLLAKYRPNMTMKDLRGKALVWLTNQPDNWKFDNSKYNNLREYLALAKGDKVYALDSSSVSLLEQNKWECPESMSEQQFVNYKGDEFEKLLKETANKPNDAYWCYNAANAYYKEAFSMPNYVTFARLGYPTFINRIANYQGCRGIILQDYAGEAKLKRLTSVEFTASCWSTVLGLTVTNLASGYLRTFVNGFLGLFGCKKRWENDHYANGVLWGVYKLALLIKEEEDTHGQELTNAIVESNFSGNK